MQHAVQTLLAGMGVGFLLLVVIATIRQLWGPLSALCALPFLIAADIALLVWMYA